MKKCCWTWQGSNMWPHITRKLCVQSLSDLATFFRRERMLSDPVGTEPVTWWSAPTGPATSGECGSQWKQDPRFCQAEPQSHSSQGSQLHYPCATSPHAHLWGDSSNQGNIQALKQVQKVGSQIRHEWLLHNDTWLCNQDARTGFSGTQNPASRDA